MAKRTRLNMRVVILVVVLLAILGGGGLYVYIRQLPQDPQVHLEKSQAYLAQDPPNWQKGIEELTKAIQASQGKPEYRLKLANLLLERAEDDTSLSQVERSDLWMTAINELRRLQLEEPDFLEGRRRLAHLMYAPTVRQAAAGLTNEGSIKGLYDYIKEVGSLLERDPQNAKLHFMRGNIHMLLAQSRPRQHIEPAIDDLKKAVALEPDNMDYWRSLVQALLRFEKDDAAVEVAEDLIRQNPDDPAAYRIKASVLRRSEAKDEDVIATLQRGVQADPQDVLALTALGSFYVDADDMAGARGIVQRAKAIEADHPQVVLLEARIAFRENDEDTGLAVLERGLKALEKASLGQGEHDNDSAGEAPRRMSTGAARALLAYELARRHMNRYFSTRDEAELEKARTFHDTLLKLSPGRPHEMAIAGMISFAEGKMQQAKQELEGARNGGIYNLRIAALLIDAYRRLGMPTEADREIRRAQTLPGQEANLGLEMEIVNTLLSARRYEEARTRLEQIARRLPDNQRIGQILWGIDIASGRRNELPPGELGREIRMLAVRRAEELQRMGKLPEAMDLLMKLLDRAPADPMVLQRVVTFLSQRNQTDQARTLLDRAIQADPDNRDLQRWRKLLDASPDERYNIELEFASQEPDPLARALEKYRIALQYGRQDDARKYIHEAETIDAANERVIMGLYQLAIRNKQWDRAQELVGRLRDQGSPNWRVLQARLKLMQEDTDGAIQDLETALQEGERQDVRLLLGEAYRAKGNYDEAKRHFLAAWDNNRRLVAAMKGLAQVAAAQERWGDHEKWIVRAWDEPQGKADPYISNRHLELVTERQNPAEAIRAREKRYQSNPNDLANVWRLAQLYEMEQRFDKAGEMYQQGFQKTGNLVWASALAMHYARADQTAKADDIFRNLAKNVTDPQEQARVYIAWGQHLSRINESEAEHMFDKAIELASDAAFPYAAKADFLTNRARRLRTRGNDAEAKTLYADAVEMLETSLRQDGQNLARKRQLHLRQIDAGAYDEAITGFQQMLENNADDIQARVGLGRALMMKRDYDAARLQFNRAIQSDRTHADAHRSLAELYQRQGELADAFQALENAVRNAPDNIHLQMGLAQLYASAGQTNDAANAYLRVIENNPRYRPAYEGVISLLRRDRRQWKNALQWAQEARETFPSDLDFLVIEASIHRDLRQWPQVVDSYRRALDIDPGNHALTREYLTAVLATRDGQALQAAIKQYQDREDLAGVIQAVRAAWQAQQGTAAEQVIPQFVEALKNARDNADILAIWAVMADAVDFRPLAENMPTIVSADERNWRLNRLAGQTLAQPGPEAGYFPQAEEWYRRALALAGTRDDRLDVLRHMAILYEQGRNTAQYGQEYLKKAQQTYQDMLAIDRDDIVACNNLAYLYTDVLDQPKKALELIERALAHRPASRNLIDTHAWALAKAGQYDRAERKLKEIINRSGDRPSPDYLYHLGFVKEKQGAKNEARGYYKQAIQAIDRLGDQEDNPLRQKVFDALQRVTDTSS